MKDSNLVFKAFTSGLDSFFSQHPQLAGEAIEGHCDAFCVALSKEIDQTFGEKVSTHPVVIARQRVSLESDKVFDENPFSHVFLRVVIPGEDEVLADAYGVDADLRWENEWIQPHIGDEVEECEDVFDYQKLNFAELEALRNQRDQRDISKPHVSKFRAALKECLTPGLVAVANALGSESLPKVREKPVKMKR